jgi:hypothetical protein
VHAVDERSMLQTTLMQGLQVTTARGFCGPLPVCVSPVTLRIRQPGAPADGGLPPDVDPRQPSLFTAAWTMASVTSLAAAGASSVTYFETRGGRGVIETAAGSPDPAQFASAPHIAFAVYHVLADAIALAGRPTRPLVAGDPTEPTVAGLLTDASDDLVIQVANLTPERQEIALPGPGGWRARVLDEDSARHAMLDPAAHRSTTTHVDATTLALGPYGYARLTAERAG